MAPTKRGGKTKGKESALNVLEIEELPDNNNKKSSNKPKKLKAKPAPTPVVAEEKKHVKFATEAEEEEKQTFPTEVTPQPAPAKEKKKPVQVQVESSATSTKEVLKEKKKPVQVGSSTEEEIKEIVFPPHSQHGFIIGYFKFLGRFAHQMRMEIRGMMRGDDKPKWVNSYDPNSEYLDDYAKPWMSWLYIKYFISMIYLLLIYIPSVLVINMLSFIVLALGIKGKKNTSLIYIFITELVFINGFMSEKSVKFSGKMRTLLAHYFTPSFVEDVVTQWKLSLLRTPKKKRGFFWAIKNKALDVHNRINYFLRIYNPPRYFKQLNESANCKGDEPLPPNKRTYFPFGGGVAVATYDSVTEFIANHEVERDKETPRWTVNTLGAGYSEYNPSMLSGDDEKRALAKRFIEEIMRTVTKRAADINVGKIKAAAKRWDPERRSKRLYLNRFLQENKHYQISDHDLVRTIGDLKFYLVTGGQFTADEAAAYEFLNKDSQLIYPWNRLPGHPRRTDERKAYDVLRKALWRRVPFDDDLRKILAIFGKDKQADALRLLTVIFCVFLDYTTKLSVSVLNRLYNDPINGVSAYKNDPTKYILESARLNRSVPMVSHANPTDKQIQIGKYKFNLEDETPLHLVISEANRDFTKFHHPYLFDSTRDNCEMLLTFKAIQYATCCEQTAFALDVTSYVTNRFMPSEKYTFMKISTSESINSYYTSALDGFTLVMMAAIGSLSLNFPRAIEMYVPTIPIDKQLYALSQGPVIPLIDEDNITGDSMAMWIGREALNSTAFAVQDLDTQWNSIDEAKMFIHMHFGPGLPLPNVEYAVEHPGGLNSDEVMSRLAFFAMPCYYTRRTTAEEKVKYGANLEFVNDAAHVGSVELHTLPVRNNYDKYGALAFFDQEYAIKGIWWSQRGALIKPGEKEWEHAKWVWKSSWFMVMTVNDHLMVTHLIEANVFAKAVQLKLPIDHPLRPLLKPFTFKTVTVNKNAYHSLINERGFVHRLWAFDYSVFITACREMFKSYKFRKFYEYAHESMRDVPDHDFPFTKDSKDFWDVIRAYVAAYFNNYPDIFYTCEEFREQLIADLSRPGSKLSIDNDDDLIDVITQLIVNGTAKHELVGQVIDYTGDPTFVGAKLQPHCEINNVQTYTQMMALTLLTGFRMPMLKDDWSHLFTSAADLKVYENFRKNLNEYERGVDKRNNEHWSNTDDVKKQRRYKFKHFHPQKLECSVSI